MSDGQYYVLDTEAIARERQAMQDDVAECLRVLRLGDHARPLSPHAVMESEVIPVLKQMQRAVEYAYEWAAKYPLKGGMDEEAASRVHTVCRPFIESPDDRSGVPALRTVPQHIPGPQELLCMVRGCKNIASYRRNVGLVENEWGNYESHHDPKLAVCEEHRI